MQPDGGGGGWLAVGCEGEDEEEEGAGQLISLTSQQQVDGEEPPIIHFKPKGAWLLPLFSGEKSLLLMARAESSCVGEISMVFELLMSERSGNLDLVGYALTGSEIPSFQKFKISLSSERNFFKDLKKIK